MLITEGWGVARVGQFGGDISVPRNGRGKFDCTALGGRGIKFECNVFGTVHDYFVTSLLQYNVYYTFTPIYFLLLFCESWQQTE